MSEQLSDRQWANILYHDLQLAEAEIAKLKAENATYREAIEPLYDYHDAMASLEIDRLRKALEVNEDD